MGLGPNDPVGSISWHEIGSVNWPLDPLDPWAPWPQGPFGHHGPLIPLSLGHHGNVVAWEPWPHGPLGTMAPWSLGHHGLGDGVVGTRAHIHDECKILSLTCGAGCAHHVLFSCTGGVCFWAACLGCPWGLASGAAGARARRERSVLLPLAAGEPVQGLAPAPGRLPA